MDKTKLLPLKPEHIDQVLEIERVSFPTPWSRESFLGELLQNSLAYYFACLQDDVLIGYAGMWIIIDEAHITNVAVHPDYRGKKLGEIMILHMMAEALKRGAYKMTVGLRKGYYTDTDEDAIIMWKDLTLD